MKARLGTAAQLAMGAIVLVVVLIAPKILGSEAYPSARLAPPFWGWLAVVGSEAETYDSLASMTRAADAVVIGEIADLRDGRKFGSAEDGWVYYPRVMLRVERILAGALPSSHQRELVLEFATLEPPDIDSLRRALVDMGGLYFLRNKGVSAAMAGQPISRQQAESDYYRVVNSNGWLLPEGDTVILPLAWEESAITAAVAGRTPTEVVAAIEGVNE